MAQASDQIAGDHADQPKFWPGKSDGYLRRSGDGSDQAGPTLERITRPRSSGRVNCGQ